MRKLSFYILGIILLFVVIIVVSPFFIGNSLQSGIQTKLNKFEQKHPGVQISVADYNRHWFSSDATLAVSYQLPSIITGFTRTQPIKLTVNMHIEHGPIIAYTIDGKKHHELAKAALLISGPPDSMEGQITTIINWNKSTRTLFDVKRLAFKDAKMNFLLQGLTGYVTHDTMPSTINYAITIQKLVNTSNLLKNVSDTMSMSDGAGSGTLTKEDGIWVGKITASRQSMSMMRNKKSVFSFKQFKQTLDSTVTNERADYKFTLNAADSSFAGQPYGPLSLTFDASQLDVQALNKIIAAAESIYLGGNSVTFSNLTSIYPPLLKLMEKGMSLSLKNFKLALPDSQAIQANVTAHFAAQPNGLSILHIGKGISLNGNLSLPRAFMLQQLTGFFQDMIAKKELSTDPTLAGTRAKATLAHWVGNKMFITGANTSLKTQFTIKNGEIKVNGIAPNFALTHTTKKRYNNSPINKG